MRAGGTSIMVVICWVSMVSCLGGLSRLRHRDFHGARSWDFPALPGFHEARRVVAAPLAAAVEPLHDEFLRQLRLLDLLPLVAFTGLYQPSGGCEPPCGLCNFVPCGDLRFRFAFRRRTAPGSLCTLQSCCFPTRGPRPLGMMFGDAVSSAILMG